MLRLGLTLLVLASLTASAGESLGVLRTQVSAAAAEADTTRTELNQKRVELSAVSQKAEALKAQSKGKLVRGGQLEAVLKSSQELSAAVTALSKSLATQEAALASARTVLLQELSASLERTQARFDSAADRTARLAVLDELRALRKERDALRASVPTSQLPEVALTTSQNPEDLLEQAELLKDAEDRATRELKALEVQLKEARAEVALDQRVRRFLGDEALFDEHDRRVRPAAGSGPGGAVLSSAKGSNDTAGSGAPPPGGNGESARTINPNINTAPTNAFTQGPQATAAPTSDFAPSAPVDSASSSADRPASALSGFSATAPTATRGDARPAIGVAARPERDDGSVASLERRKASLKKLVEELRAKAAEFEAAAQKAR